MLFTDFDYHTDCWRYEPFSQSGHFQLRSLHDRCWALTIDLKWRYDINYSKSCIVTFGETKPQHSESLKHLEWLLGDIKVDELYKYENIGVLKNYVVSFPLILTIIPIRLAKRLI